MAAGVRTFVGEIGARTCENEGLNANLGLVLTPEGTLLIDSGATWQSAQAFATAAAKVGATRIKSVVNTGGQDHRWLDNGLFKAQGAELVAHANGQADMQSRGSEYLQGLRVVLAAKADGTLPTRWISGENESLELGGLRIELKHRGSALTPGDRRVWPQQQCVLFSGDVVYTQRMSRVLPVGNTKHWLQTSAIIEALKPRVLVPGHGAPTDVATAKAGTQAYLFALREHMKQAVDEGQDVSPAVRSFDARLFMRLLNAAELMPGNTSRTYLELERE